NNLADVFYCTGQLDQADMMYSKAQAVFDGWVRESPSNRDAAWRTSVICNTRAALQIERGHIQVALDLYSHAIDVMEPIAKREPKARENYTLLDSYTLRAGAYELLGLDAKARGDWQRLAKAAAGMATSRHAVDRALALAHLGQCHEGVALLAVDDP